MAKLTCNISQTTLQVITINNNYNNFIYVAPFPKVQSAQGITRKTKQHGNEVKKPRSKEQVGGI
jgi:hypothetical protein